MALLARATAGLRAPNFCWMCSSVGSIGESPFVQATKAERIDVEFDRKVLYELDGGDRKEVKRLKVKVKPDALTVMVPQEKEEDAS